MSQHYWLWSAVVGQIHSTFQNGSPYGAPALLGALLFTIGYYLHRRLARGQPISVGDFLRSIFPARILWHPSSRVDMRMWMLNGLVLASAYGWLAVSGFGCRDLTVSALSKVFGVHAPLAWPIAPVLLISTVLELLAYELAYWFGHYLFHRYAWLWEFHKVHHSAEVMTTFTELRQHPIEILAFVNLIAIATGFVFGLMSYLFGPGTGHLTLLNANILLMLFLISYGHLRHSHMWIAFTGLPGKLLQSPAHHQLHHSDSPAHWDKNLGFSLALWDWAFGTLYMPAKAREDITFGVGPEKADYATVGSSFILPFARSFAHIAGWWNARHAAPRARAVH